MCGGGRLYLCLGNFCLIVGLFFRRACTLLSGLSVLVLVLSVFSVVSVVFCVCDVIAVVSVLVSVVFCV